MTQRIKWNRSLRNIQTEFAKVDPSTLYDLFDIQPSFDGKTGLYTIEGIVDTDGRPLAPLDAARTMETLEGIADRLETLGYGIYELDDTPPCLSVLVPHRRSERRRKHEKSKRSKA